MNIVKMIKSRMMKWTGHVAHTGEMRSAFQVMVGNLNGTDHLTMIILRRTLKKLNVRMWNDQPVSGQGPVPGSYEHGNEPLGSIQRGERLYQCSYCLLLKEDSAPWSQ
jgi:hypothetical protein